ncbi:hypothetical protein HK096_007400 [Nowakowskiella sp. JEL0078]|nr:hypothetical protein HK096_007400 [Nowakowskiella sp. JEL0078]
MTRAQQIRDENAILLSQLRDNSTSFSPKQVEQIPESFQYFPTFNTPLQPSSFHSSYTQSIAASDNDGDVDMDGITTSMRNISVGGEFITITQGSQRRDSIIVDDDFETDEQVPLSTNLDDASDFYPSDSNDGIPTTTIGINRSTKVRYEKRMNMLLTWWQKAGMLQVPHGFFWIAKLWRINPVTKKWTPKGPIMVVLNQGNESRPGTVLMAHYLYGTKSSAFSMQCKLCIFNK